jgi:hypothetical protein
MEINTNIIVGLLFISILILLFSKISVSVGNTDNNNNANRNIQIIRNNAGHPTIIRNNNNDNQSLSLSEAQGLPPKDAYMSNSLKQQIKEMEHKFYYNNCRWEPNF